MLYRDLITLFGRPHKTHKCKALSSAAFALLDCKGPHTRSSSLRKLFDRVWCGFVVRATVWRFSNMFEFCCATVRLCNSLKRAWTCLRAVVQRHQFIIDPHTVRILFSKCHIQLQIKNSGENLYSYIGHYRNYGKWKVMCIKTAIWRMLATTN